MTFLSVVSSPEYIDDPYPFFQELRETAPALPAGSGIWVVSRYADVVRGIRDPQLSCDFASLDSYAAYFRARGIDDRFPLPLNALDSPDHRRIRSAITPEFHPAMVEALRPIIDGTVKSILAGLAGRSVIDLVTDVAYPVPISIIGKLFRIPEDDWPLLQRWSHEFGVVSDPDSLLSDEQRQSAAEATREAGTYFGRLLMTRRQVPGDDLIGRWLATARGNRTMSLAELLVNGVFLLIVGHHNTVSLICNGMLALLRHPGQLEALRRDPSLMANGVEELLRYDSPVQTATRVTTGPYDVGGVEIPPRQQVMLLLGSANRDSSVFPEPDRLDLSRPGASRNLGLGRGMHSCLGGMLARMEVGSTLSALVNRFPGMALAGPVRRRVPCFTLRGMTSFPVRLG